MTAGHSRQQSKDSTLSEDASTRSGGVDISGESVSIAGDVVGRDKIVYSGIQRDRNLLILLEKVRTFWVEGVLENSVHHAVLIELGKQVQADAVEVDHPWDTVVREAGQPDRALPPDQRIVNTFEEMEHALLILGGPGSGKTTMLLELARDLIALAESDPVIPVPVVFNLSTWSEKRQNIVEWLVAELNTKYRVPSNMGRRWVENNDLALLLDGLDEVKAEHRRACVDAINKFRQEYGLTHLAICSRTEEYEELTARLKLNGAILIEPLSNEQIDRYVAAGGPKLAALRRTLQAEVALQELAQLPLMLSIMSLAYSGWSIDDLLGEWSDFTRRRKHLFDAYVTKMFARMARTQHEIFLREHTVHWLTWLAQRMMEHTQSVFLIERMQPDWLPTRKQKSLYNLCVVLAVVLPVGLLMGLGVGVPVALSGYSAAGQTFGLTVGMAFGLAVWLALGGQASGLVGRLFVGLAFGLAFGLTFSQVFGLEIGLPFGLAVGLIAGVAFGLVSRHPIRRIAANKGQIESIETLNWSWSKAASGLAGGLIVGFAFGLILWLAIGQYYGLALGLVFGLAFGSACGLAAGLFRGLSGLEMEMSMAPNQGIMRSAQNALTIGLSVWLGVGLLVGLASGFAWELVFRANGLTVGLIIGVTIGLSFGIAVGLFFGGLTCIKHFMLRLFLYLDGLMPWNCARFLDYATDRIFLRKVGGSYIFIHRLLMDYFSSLEPGRSK